MRFQTLLLSIALFCMIGQISGKTVFRRTDKLSENFKKVDLPDEEIDPNVAPPAAQLIDTIDPEDANTGTGSIVGTASGDDDVIEEADDVAVATVAEAAAPAVAAANAVIDQAANEVDAVVVTAAEAVATPIAAPAVATPNAAAVTPVAAVAAAVATTAKPVKNEDDLSAISKYCKCTDSHCDCCREFALPILPVRGPGCAKITYLGNEKMSVSIKYGDITLATRTISSKRAKPICVGLPGGYSQFCGRVYGLSKAKEDFKACLGFELRAEDEVEAALRVSCFKFGPEGLRVAAAEPLPSEVQKPDEDDDDDDIFGFAAGGDDEDDDDDYDGDDDDADDADDADDDADTDDDDDDYTDDDDETEAPADADYGGFSLGGLLAELAGDDDEPPVKAKPTVASVAPVATPEVAVTRNAVQSKDEMGTEAVAATTLEAAEAALSAEEAAVAALVTAAPAESAAGATTEKTKKGKKAKKNKKKKAVASNENDFAYDIINGILDFFN